MRPSLPGLPISTDVGMYLEAGTAMRSIQGWSLCGTLLGPLRWVEAGSERALWFLMWPCSSRHAFPSASNSLCRDKALLSCCASRLCYCSAVIAYGCRGAVWENLWHLWPGFPLVFVLTSEYVSSYRFEAIAHTLANPGGTYPGHFDISACLVDLLCIAVLLFTDGAGME